MDINDGMNMKEGADEIREQHVNSEHAERERGEAIPDARNVVFIGKKSTMNYVLAVVTQFNSGLPEVMIKARGRAISKAVDVQQIVANKFISTLRNKEIKLSTESMLNEDGTRSRVSAIQITVTK